MPFHSVPTVEEADALVDKFCHVKYVRVGDVRRPEFAVTRTWREDDATTAMRSAAEQFDLDPLR